MHYTAIADTDIGIVKTTNQDSILIKHGQTPSGEVLMAIICDGMGGLAKGELASATVIRAFAKWFDQELPYELEKPDLQVVAAKWSLMLKDLNAKILQYGQNFGTNLGTTFTGMLFVGEQHMIIHVGDSRAYRIAGTLQQLTTDQTFVAREISLGHMTPEQAKVDKRRNLLLQCVGASKIVEPQIIFGNTEKGVYMLCSDGFRHEITPKEIYEALNPISCRDAQAMQNNSRYLINQVKARQEKDNISVVVLKVE